MRKRNLYKYLTRKKNLYKYLKKKINLYKYDDKMKCSNTKTFPILLLKSYQNVHQNVRNISIS